MRSVVVSIVVLLACCRVTLAEPPAQERSVTVRVTPRAIHYFGADLDDHPTSSGDVSVSRFGALASIEFPIGAASAFTIGAEYTYSFYDFDGSGIFEDSLGLLEDAYEIGLTGTWSSRIDDTWSYFLGGGMRISAESGADLSDSLSFRGFGGVNYRISDRLLIGGGLAVTSRLEDDALFVPLVNMHYAINDQWSFAAGGGPAAAGRTLGGTLSWRPREDIGLGLTVAWDRREFRLDDSGPIPDGVGIDSRVDLALGLDWVIGPGVTVRFETGASVWQEYRFEDDDGRRVLETNTDPTPFIGASIGFEF